MLRRGERGYPLKLPSSVKKAARRIGGDRRCVVEPFIAAAVAEKVGSLRGARLSALARRIGETK